jgi:hypothetical protein
MEFEILQRDIVLYFSLQKIVTVFTKKILAAIAEGEINTMVCGTTYNTCTPVKISSYIEMQKMFVHYY